MGRLERLAYERNERDLELVRKGHPLGYYFDAAAADYTVRWIEKYCRHHKGEWAGRRLILEEWQRWTTRQVFGWKRPDGSRRFRKVWKEVPRKNGKTEEAAAIGVHLMVGDNEPGSEVYTTATAKEQASICHDAARQMVKQSPELSQSVRVPKAKLANLTCDKLGSKMQILSSDYGTLDGLSPHGDIRDEVHAWTDHELAGVLTTAMGSRRQPLTLEVTTAGLYDAEGVGWQHHDYAVQVLEQTFDDDRLFAFITTIDEGDDPWSPAAWAKANPNLGVSLKYDFIAGNAAEAQRSAHAANSFLRLHCNVWTNQVTRWLNMERWKQCDSKPLDLAALAQIPCYGGLDLSRTTDLTAFVLVWALPGGEIAILPTFWLPQAKIDEELLKKGQSRYQNWVNQGFLKATPGNVVEYDFIRKEIFELSKRFKIRQLGFDPHSADQLSIQLQGDGIKMVEVTQGFRNISEPSKYLEGRILERKVHHQGHPVLSWCVSNAVVVDDSYGNIRPDKKRAKDKIDGVSATVTALSLFVQAKPTGGSYLERRGLVVLG